MALTKQDLTDIRVVVIDAINESFEALSAPRFDALEQRMSTQEKELRSFKNEVYARFGQMDTKLQELTDKITMLDEDVRALYGLLDEYKATVPGKKGYARLTIDKKMDILHSELHKTAKQAGITLQCH